jgi:hypothetical protein
MNVRKRGPVETGMNLSVLTRTMKTNTMPCGHRMKK